MGTIETIGVLFCLAAVCVLLTLMIRSILPRRRKRRAELPETAQEEPEELKPEKYTPIYEYVLTRGFIRCPECDGENDTAASYCCICASRLRK